MDEFIIDEHYEQICINSEGNIEISGLWARGAFNIVRDSASAGIMTMMTKANVAEKCHVIMEVEHNSVILTKGKLTVLLNPDEYPFEAIVINIK